MAQALIYNFVKELSERIEFPDPIVEFGSYRVEKDQANDLRALFPDRDIVGTDMRMGPGVDRVEDLRRLSFEDGSVGTAICLDTLEHCQDPPQACREMHRVIADGGVCIISSVMLFGIHGYPNDYFRFTPEGFRSMLEGFESQWVAGVGNPEIPIQVVGVGRKSRELKLDFHQFPALVRAQERWAAPARRVRIGLVDMPASAVGRTLLSESVRIARRRGRSLVGKLGR